MATYPGGSYFEYAEVYDRNPDLGELLTVIRNLDPIESIVLLCQINLDLRLVEKKREPFSKMQQEIASGFLDDQTIGRFQHRFGYIHLGDRPIFHPPQILNVLRLVILNAEGPDRPFANPMLRHKLGTACLMMNGLALTPQEKTEISTGTNDDRRRFLMTQMLSPFEVVNTAALAHVIYRSRIMFHILLGKHAVTERIRKQCAGFDFEKEFLRIVHIPLQTWLMLLLGFYAYFLQYMPPDGERNPEYLAIDRLNFKGNCPFAQTELEKVLKVIGLPLCDFKQLLAEARPVDWRYDYSPFKSKPLIELAPNKFYCSDLGFLIEKMHSGVFWAANDGLTQSERPKLFKAWGILFEEYVNWFLSNRTFTQPLLFFPSPVWAHSAEESFDGAFLQDSRFMPLEYKGGFLKLEARYSGNAKVFEADLDLKIGAGCQQLASKIEKLFNSNPKTRRRLRDVPLDHITRVLPVLVVQDLILRGPLINWWLNKRFNELLHRDHLRPGVTIEPLNVVGIHELESLAESAEAGTFGMFEGLQLRCFSDPEMLSELHNFLIRLPGYGGKTGRIEKILEEQWEEVNRYLFGEQT